MPTGSRSFKTSHHKSASRKLHVMLFLGCHIVLMESHLLQWFGKGSLDMANLTHYKAVSYVCSREILFVIFLNKQSPWVALLKSRGSFCVKRRHPAAYLNILKVPYMLASCRERKHRMEPGGSLQDCQFFQGTQGYRLGLAASPMIFSKGRSHTALFPKASISP